MVGVETEILYTDPVVIKAVIKIRVIVDGDEKIYKFTGISAANASKQIEKESPYEVAETSAVGRALAFAGYETPNGVASAEEMKKVVYETIPEKHEFSNSVCQKCGGKIQMSKMGKPYCPACVKKYYESHPKL